MIAAVTVQVLSRTQLPKCMVCRLCIVVSSVVRPATSTRTTCDHSHEPASRAALKIGVHKRCLLQRPRLVLKLKCPKGKMAPGCDMITARVEKCAKSSQSFAFRTQLSEGLGLSKYFSVDAVSFRGHALAYMRQGKARGSNKKYICQPASTPSPWPGKTK